MMTGEPVPLVLTPIQLIDDGLAPAQTGDPDPGLVILTCSDFY